MTFFLEKLKEKIYKELKVEDVLLIDKSKLHTKHRSFDSTKYHLKLIIKSEKLKSMNKIDAHKLIFSTLKQEINSKIHALEIKIN